MGARHRPAVSSLAVASLSAATIAGLALVFEGASWVAPVLGAAVVPHLVVLAGRRLGWPGLVTGVLVVALGVVYGTVVVETATSAHGLPTSTSFGQYVEHLRDAPEILRSAEAPVAPTGAALLLAITAVWTMATAAAGLAGSRRPTLAPLAPSLVLFVSLAALGRDDHVLVTAVYAIAAGGVLLAQRHAAFRPGTTLAAPGLRARRGGRIGGAAATLLVIVGAGSVIAPVLPGSGAPAIIDYRDLGNGGGPGKWEIRSPLVDIRTRLVEDPRVELFTVSSPRPAYWRMVALDRFDGEAWELDSQARSVDDELPLDRDIVADSIAVTQQFRIGPFDTAWLPAAYRPRRINLPGTRVIGESLSLLTPGRSAEGLVYEVVSEIPIPSEAQLRSAPPARHRDLAPYLELPDAFPQPVRTLAHEVTADATTPYEQALALQDWLRDGTRFTYTLDARPGHSADALVDFLFETRRGYCEQFAGAFAAMARAVGLPARVAVGFTSGELDADAGVYRVTTSDAHSWPEVYLVGIGWTAFEPTPGRYEPSPRNPTRTGTETDVATPTLPQTTTSTTVASGRPAPPASAPPRDPRGVSTRATDPGATSNPAEPLLRAAVGAVLVAGTAALTGALTVVAAKARLRRRRRSAPAPRARIRGAWQEALDRLSEAGITRQPSATPVEFALRHAPAHGAGTAGPALMELARLHTAASYSQASFDDHTAARAWGYVEQIARSLRSTCTPGERLRRFLDPRPVLRRVRRDRP